MSFPIKLLRVEMINSFHWTSYVGSSGSRAYLEYGHPAWIGKGVRSTVYWIPVEELPADVARQIRAGEAPWTGPLR